MPGPDANNADIRDYLSVRNESLVFMLIFTFWKKENVEGVNIDISESLSKN